MENAKSIRFHGAFFELGSVTQALILISDFFGRLLLCAGAFLFKEGLLMCKNLLLGKDAATGIRYLSFGHGPKTMVIVPGLNIGYVTDAAQAVAEGFAAFAADYRVYLFDIREAVPADYSLEAMAEDLAVAIRGLGLQRIYLYGASMGGMESICLASKHPELVEKLAVASSSCLGNETSEAVIGGWIRLAEEGKCRELTADMGRRIYSAPVYEAFRETFAAMADGLDGEALTRFRNTARVIRNLDLRERAAKITCPVFVLGSLGDRVLTAAGAKKIAELTGGELYIYGEETSHAIYDEIPELRQRVKAFFDGKD